MGLYDKVKNFVDEAYKKWGKSSIHFEATVKWIKKLKPNAEEYLLIAGYAHDIDRPFSKKAASLKPYQEGLSFTDKAYLKEHQGGSAKIISNFLEKEKADDDLIKKVSYLVLHHEEGGTEEADILKDADSLSYFEVNAEKHVKWIHIGISKEQIKEKMDWMFNRITLEKAKEWCKPLYERGLKLLENE